MVDDIVPIQAVEKYEKQNKAFVLKIGGVMYLLLPLLKVTVITLIFTKSYGVA